MNRPTPTPFQLAYIEAALFSTNDEADDSGGVPLDDNYDIDDIDTRTLIAMCHECAAFECQVARLLETAEYSRGTGEYSKLEQAGHDFWMTRNGHGVGFWDGDWSEPQASVLTRVAKAYGERNLYVSNGRIYQMGAE